MKIRYVKLNFIETIFLVLVIFIVMSELLSQSISSQFLYADDICLALIMVLGLSKLLILKKKNLLLMTEKNMLVIIGILIIIGIAGNVKTQYQENKFAILQDIFGWQKFFLTYLCFIICIKKQRSEKYYNTSIIISKMIILIGIILEILNILKIINLTPGYERFGLNAFSLGGHPSAASAILAAIISILLYDENKNRTWIILAIILEVATFRFKAIAFVLLITYCMFFMKKKFSIMKILAICIVIIAITWSQIEFYFISSTASRAVALKTSIEIANDYFPIGSGFATFGTSMSGKYYSKAYKVYGLSNRWGFSEKHYEFIGDGGIANIIAQFGYLGTVLYMVLIVLLLKSVQKRWHKEGKIVPYISVIGYILISSSNEGGFNSAYAILLALSLVIMCKKELKTTKRYI